jgi:hypothetical protein
MKVIALTTEQKSQLATLSAAQRTAAQSAGAANKAYRDYVLSIVGPQMNALQRIELTDDGNSLVVG